jgi:hypothetical protein
MLVGLTTIEVAMREMVTLIDARDGSAKIRMGDAK